MLNLFVLISSAKPQEFNDRLEKRHEAKKEVLGRSKQAEFVRRVEEEVRQSFRIVIRNNLLFLPQFCLFVNVMSLVLSWRNERRGQEPQEDSPRTR